jgi:hypothetical protein
MKPKVWPVSGREVTQHRPEGLNFSSSKIISFWPIGNLSQSAACLQRVVGRQDRRPQKVCACRCHSEMRQPEFMNGRLWRRFVDRGPIRPEKSECQEV